MIKQRVALIVALALLMLFIAFKMIELKDNTSASTDNVDDNVVYEEPEILITAVGDIMLGRYVQTQIKEDYEMPLDEVKEIFNNADLRFGNLECVLSDDKNIKHIKGKDENFCLKASKNMAKVLNSVNFNILSIANNHIYDYDSKGFTDTLNTLKENEIEYVGGGNNLDEAKQLKTILVKNKKIGFLAYSSLYDIVFSDRSQVTAANEIKPGVAPLKIEDILRDIESSKKSCDLLIISLHWGDEYTKIPNEKQIEWAHKIVDSGADIILGHHPHVLQGVEVYKGKPIIYSMGNFLFDQNNELNKDSAIFNLKFKGNEFEGLDIIPILIKDKKRVAVASDDEYLRIAEYIINCSELLGTELKQASNKIYFSVE